MSRQYVLAGLVPRFADASVTRALSWVTATHLRAALALALLCVACFLPGISTIPPVDRDEARFVQATKQMLETGNYVDIRMHDEPRYKKPVGIYWLQAAFVTMSGHGADAPIWAYRLASVFGATAAVLLTYWATLPLFGRRAAFIAGAALAASMILTAEAHLAKTDAVLAATIVLTMGSLARIYLWPGPERPPLRSALSFWIGLGLGILVKGPIAPMVALLTIVSLVAVERRAKWLVGLRPLIGVPLCLAIVLPWFVAILSVAGVAFLKQSVGTDLLGKVATGQESHGAPPGTHFVVFWLIFWPGAVLVPLAVRWVWRHRADAPVRFCLAWIIPSWIVFEAVATKLPHYTLPTYPAIAALLGGAVAADGLVTGRLWTRLVAIPAALIAIALPIAATIGLDRLEGILSVPAIVLVVIVAGLGAGAVTAGFRDAPLTSGGLLLAAAVPAYFAVFGVAAPQLESLHVSSRLARAVSEVAPCPAPEVVSAGFDEASLIFLVGTRIRFASGRDAAEFLAEGGCRVALVSDKSESSFLKRVASLGIAVEKPVTVEGINIGRLGKVSVAVFRVHPDR